MLGALDIVSPAALRRLVNCCVIIIIIIIITVWNSLSRDSFDFLSPESLQHYMYVLYTYPDSALPLII